MDVLLQRSGVGPGRRILWVLLEVRVVMVEVLFLLLVLLVLLLNGIYRIGCVTVEGRLTLNGRSGRVGLKLGRVLVLFVLVVVFVLGVLVVQLWRRSSRCSLGVCRTRYRTGGKLIGSDRLLLVVLVLELIVTRLSGVVVEKRDVVRSWRKLGEKGRKIWGFGDVAGVLVSRHGHGQCGLIIFNQSARYAVQAGAMHNANISPD